VVFADTESDSFTVDPAQVASKVTPRTVGIVPVHMCGEPADMDPIMEVARHNGLWVLEDCAQAHLATYKGRLVGTIGNAGAFSFYPGKNLGAMGDAGCIVTNDSRLSEWCSLFARHGGKGNHVMEGVNSRLDGIQAAVLSAKLPHLPRWTEQRRQIAATYSRGLAAIPGLSCPLHRSERDHVYHLYMIRTDQRDALRSRLESAGIATSLNYPRALPFYPAYAYLGHTPSDFPNAHRHQHEILSLPLYPEMPPEAVGHVIGSIRAFFGS
jgi:dTDP-4-amino-4,6-dideoxygalactose transaminase